MGEIHTEATRLTAMIRQVQDLGIAAATGSKDASLALGTQLSELVRELDSKIQNKESMLDQKLGILFTFYAWFRIDAEAPTHSQLTKFFENKGNRLILRSPKLDDEVLKQVQEYASKPQEVISWVTLPQPGTPGTMSLSKGKSFVKKIVSISKGAGGGFFDCILEDRFTQPITEELLDRMPNPDLGIFFRLGILAPSIVDLKDKYEEDEEEEELQRNNELDDMF